MMNDISFYLIHNNSEDRIDLRNRLKKLSNNFNLDLTEIHKQKKNLKTKFGFRSKLKILKINCLRIFYDLKHKKECSFQFYFFLLKSLLSLNKSNIKIIIENKSRSIKTQKHFKIESLVTKKHIKAWEHFLKSKQEIMVIFEDDAICKNNTEKRLKDVIQILKSFELDHIFIDLAGGYNPRDIIPKKKINNSKNDFMIVDGIYTNTACSYLMTRSLIKKLYKEYQKSKLNNYFPIDHLINKLGLKIRKRHNISSIHFYNPLFTHGSFKGNIRSWQNY